jgi:uncharacterized phage protein gp47/JayE
LTNYDYQAILARMLSRIPDSLDKREGSIIFDALAPAAYELADFYRQLAEAYLNTFVDTASGAALQLKAGELGVSRETAVCAVRKGIFKDGSGILMDVAIGSRFSTMDGAESLNFYASEKISTGIFKLSCEEAGAGGNDYVGDLLPINHIEGLGTAEMTDIIVPGQAVESDDSLRQRVKQYVRSAANDGNAAQYLAWADAFEGVGQTKVFALWNGVNTVKVSILNSLNRLADSALVEDFQDYLDPSDRESFSGDGANKVFTLAAAKPTWLNLVTVDGVRMEPGSDYTYDGNDGTITFTAVPADGAVIKVCYRGGLGNGVAPIGAIVTVTTAGEKTLAVAATAELATGYTLEQAETEVQALLEAFFNELAYTSERVNYIEVGAIILSAASVEAVSGLSINSAAIDITLAAEEIPILGSLALTEAV